MKKDTVHITCALIVFIPFLLMAMFLSPQEVHALSLFTPFGGKVKSWIPEAEGCTEITAAIAAVTVGTVIVTIEKLEVGKPMGGTFGILRIDGFTVPGLTKIYKSKLNYRVPNVWVIGSSFDLCNMGGMGGIVKKITDAVCGIAAEGCPINNLVHRIGSGGIVEL